VRTMGRNPSGPGHLSGLKCLNATCRAVKLIQGFGSTSTGLGCCPRTSVGSGPSDGSMDAMSSVRDPGKCSAMSRASDSVTDSVIEPSSLFKTPSLL
jgi:hypothetical protein